MEKVNLNSTDFLVSKKIESISNLIAKHKETSFSLFLSTLLYVVDNEILEEKLIDLNKEINNIKLPTFCAGLIGVGWYYQFLVNKNILDISDVNDLLLQIDEIAYNSAISAIKENNHDFLHGAVGQAIYLIERLDFNQKAYGYLDEIMQSLYKISKKDERGIYWEESTFYLKEHELGKKIINISLAHGLAGKIVLFSKLYKNRVNSKLSKSLLEGSVQFMLNIKNQKGSTSVFPVRIEEKCESNYSRLGWCYGDLGICIALWQAGETLDDEIIKNEAIQVCLHTTHRKEFKDTGVMDAGLCHGTAGVSHIYNRMYHYTGKSEFKEAARYWLKETLNMSKFEDGLAGYKCYSPINDSDWINEYGFLEGLSGIGLALKSSQTDEEPTWDKCLLLS